jgi:Putative homoserine kinase type II (protein kinase fold)
MATGESGNVITYTDAPTRQTPACEGDAALAAAIVTEALRLSVRHVTPINGLGSVNLVFQAETEGDAVVVRFGKPGDDSAAKRAEYEKERLCLLHAAAAGMPGPKPLSAGECGGRPFLLLSRVPGTNGSEQNTVLPDALYRTLGRYARALHDLPATTGFEAGDPQDVWLRFADYNLGELTASDPLIGLGVYAPGEQAAIRDTFAWLRGLSYLRVGLNHGDLSPRNTVVDPATGTVYLLDWGCAEVQLVPHYDLNTLFDGLPPPMSPDPLRAAFLDGYGMTAAEWVTLLPELRAFSLLKAFDLTRWAIDRCPARVPELAARAAAAFRAWYCP